MLFWSDFILRSNSFYQQTINYEFCLNKLIICCLLIVSKVVVKVRVLRRIRDVEYDIADYVFYKFQ